MNYAVSFDYGKNTIKVATSPFGNSKGALAVQRLSVVASFSLILAFFASGFILAYFLSKLARNDGKKKSG